MQFLAQIYLADLGDEALGGKVMLIFMCHNAPGLCEEWDANAGGNRCFVVPAHGLALLSPPKCGVTLLEEVSGVRYESFEGNYDDTRNAWEERPGHSLADVLGQLGGEPAWIQADETPSCDDCHVRMRFIVQLEQGHEFKTSMNFGGGCAYAFICPRCAEQAKFLWQQ